MLLGSPKEHLRQTHKSIPTRLCKSLGRQKTCKELMDRNGGRAKRRFIFLIYCGNTRASAQVHLQIHVLGWLYL